MLLDSNIIMYAAQPGHTALREFIADHTPAVSMVSYIEVLGYHCLSGEEQRFLERFFHAAEVLSLSEPVVQWAIRLRQRRRMTLDDAMVGGTAVTPGRNLVSHNTDDFRWISEIQLLDPLAERA